MSKRNDDAKRQNEITKSSDEIFEISVEDVPQILCFASRQRTVEWSQLVLYGLTKVTCCGIFFSLKPRAFIVEDIPWFSVTACLAQLFPRVLHHLILWLSHDDTTRVVWQICAKCLFCCCCCCCCCMCCYNNVEYVIGNLSGIL